MENGKIGVPVAVAVLAVGLTVVARGSVIIEVAQESAPGAGDFDDNALGVVETFTSSMSAEAYYNWDAVDFSFDPPPGAFQPGTADDQSSVFFGMTPDGVTMFHVHDHDETSSDGGSASNTWTILNDTAELLAENDANGDETFLGGGTSMLSVPNFTWSGSRTDGTAIGSLDGDIGLCLPPLIVLAAWICGGRCRYGTAVDLVLAAGRRARFARSRCRARGISTRRAV